MQCELCGAKTENLSNSKIEGVILSVCNKCFTLGKPIEEKKPQSSQKPKLEERIVAGYGNIIKNAREKKGMRQVDFAKMLQIKDSFLHHIETESQPLNIFLAKKIEENLGITLVKKFKPSVEFEEHNTSNEFTLGDLLKKKK